jgi:tetratricopeptide (TPR) repeat protein
MPRLPSFRAYSSALITIFIGLPLAAPAKAQTDYLALCRADDVTDRLRVEACGFAGRDEALPAEARADALSRRAQVIAGVIAGQAKGDSGFALRDLARADFEEALRLAPENTDIKRRYLAFNNHWTGKADVQLATANALLTENGEDPEALLQRGLAYMRKGDNAKALADVMKSAELNPTNVDTFIAMGQLLTNMMRNEESYQAYTKALELAPTRDEIRLHRMGPALVAQHFEAVREDGDVALRGKFAMTHLWDVRGAANYMLQDYKTAAGDFAEQLKLDRLGVRALVWRFLAQYRAGTADKDEAADNARELGDHWPSSVFAFFAGNAAEGDIFAQIDQSPAELRATRIAQAHFYIAEWGLLTQAPPGSVKQHLLALRDAGIAFGMVQTTLMGEPAVMNDNNILEMSVGTARLGEIAP